MIFSDRCEGIRVGTEESPRLTLARGVGVLGDCLLLYPERKMEVGRDQEEQQEEITDGESRSKFHIFGAS